MFPQLNFVCITYSSLAMTLFFRANIFNTTIL